MASPPKFLWFNVPPFLLLTGWVNDNIVGFLAHSYIPYPRIAEYDMANKWLLCGAAAYVMADWRFRVTGQTLRVWLGLWTVVWGMLLFEVLARFFGLLGWMGGPLRRVLAPICHDCGGTESLGMLLNWAERPMIAFGAAYFACVLVRYALEGYPDTGTMW